MDFKLYTLTCNDMFVLRAHTHTHTVHATTTYSMCMFTSHVSNVYVYIGLRGRNVIDTSVHMCTSDGTLAG